MPKRKRHNAGRVSRFSRDLSIESRTRFSRDLAISLKAAETALRKAAAVAAKVGKGEASVRTTRGSRDLVKWIGKAGDAVKKARKLAPRSRGSRDL
jgi:hypothetical protein